MLLMAQRVVVRVLAAMTVFGGLSGRSMRIRGRGGPSATSFMGALGSSMVPGGGGTNWVAVWAKPGAESRSAAVRIESLNIAA
jgi:hypothetical protein